MIKFFRHIRKSLIEKNNMGKYFKYAIGEILLVVIGILIALQINNWNNGRLDREREAFLLQQINVEMKDNLKQFNYIQKRIKSLVEAGSTIIDMFPLNADKIQQESFNTNFPEFLYCPSFDPYQGTIKSIINTGDLNLIQNDSLRKLIITWEDILEDYKEEEHIAWQYGYSLTEWATDHFPNPRTVERDMSKIDLRGLQARIGEKTFRYNWCVEGEDGKILSAHIESIINLTSNL